MLKKLKEAAAEQGTTLPLLLLSDCTQVCVCACVFSLRYVCGPKNVYVLKYFRCNQACVCVCVIRHACVMLVHFAEFSPHKGV